MVPGYCCLLPLLCQRCVDTEKIIFHSHVGQLNAENSLTLCNTKPQPTSSLAAHLLGFKGMYHLASCCPTAAPFISTVGKHSDVTPGAHTAQLPRTLPLVLAGDAALVEGGAGLN